MKFEKKVLTASWIIEMHILRQQLAISTNHIHHCQIISEPEMDWANVVQNESRTTRNVKLGNNYLGRDSVRAPEGVGEIHGWWKMAGVIFETLVLTVLPSNVKSCRIGISFVFVIGGLLVVIGASWVGHWWWLKLGCWFWGCRLRIQDRSSMQG